MRGLYCQGVSFYKKYDKYVSQISIFGKTKHLGYSNIEEEASSVYKMAKSAYILHIANSNDITDIRITKALIRHADTFYIFNDECIEDIRYIENFETLLTN